MFLLAQSGLILRCEAEPSLEGRMDTAEAASTDLALLDELSDALRLTSICGLGQVVPAPIASVLRNWSSPILLWNCSEKPSDSAS